MTECNCNDLFFWPLSLCRPSVSHLHFGKYVDDFLWRAANFSYNKEWYMLVSIYYGIMVILKSIQSPQQLGKEPWARILWRPFFSVVAVHIQSYFLNTLVNTALPLPNLWLWDSYLAFTVDKIPGNSVCYSTDISFIQGTVSLLIVS